MDPLEPCSLNYLQIGTNELIIRIVAICVSVFLIALLAASQTAFYNCNKFKMTSKAEQGSKKAKVVMKLINQFDRSNINFLLCIVSLQVLVGTFSTITFIGIFKNNITLVTVLVIIILSIVMFFFSEILPRTLADLNCDRACESLAIPLYIIGIIILPIAFIFRLIEVLIKFIFRIKASSSAITEDELIDTVEDIVDEGKIDTQEKEIIQNAVEFGDFTVLDVITPVSKMVALNYRQQTRKDLLTFLKGVDFSRIPVYENSIDNIIGILHVKKYLLAVHTNKNYFTFKSILSKPLFVDQTTNIDDMLEIFQKNRTHIAIVKDSNTNKIIGMVTMEDLVEKLVGDIDEKNPPKVKLGGRKK